MRILSLAAFAAVAAATTFSSQAAGAQAPANEPLEVIVARPVGQYLYLQTSRPAYVAVFEIIPGGAVTLVYPTSEQRLVSGLRRLPLWWEAQNGESQVVKTVASTASARYVYALASEEPIRLDDSTAFVRGKPGRVAGIDARGNQNPYAVMAALSKRFVPSVREEQWAEDVQELDERRTPATGVARAYCAYGTIWEIPQELVDRAFCHASAYSVTGAVIPVRPDSVITQSGERIVAPRGQGNPGLGRISAPKGGSDAGDVGKAEPRKPIGPLANGPVPPPTE